MILKKDKIVFFENLIKYYLKTEKARNAKIIPVKTDSEGNITGGGGEYNPPP